MKIDDIDDDIADEQEDRYDLDKAIDKFKKNGAIKIDNNSTGSNNIWDSNKNIRHNGTAMTPSQVLQYINELSAMLPHISRIRIIMQY